MKSKFTIIHESTFTFIQLATRCRKRYKY